MLSIEKSTELIKFTYTLELDYMKNGDALDFSKLTGWFGLFDQKNHCVLIQIDVITWERIRGEFSYEK